MLLGGVAVGVCQAKRDWREMETPSAMNMAIINFRLLSFELIKFILSARERAQQLEEPVCWSGEQEDPYWVRSEERAYSYQPLEL